MKSLNIPVISKKWITRRIVQSNRDKLFVFGDNVARKGYGGQAKEVRDEPNSFGIPTKWHPTTLQTAYFSDKDEEINIVIDSLRDLVNTFNNGSYTHIVWPIDGIGTGLAELPTRSPKIANMLQQFRDSLAEDYLKQQLILRRDLNMRTGKMVAQGAHASMKATLENINDLRVQDWLDGAFTKICLYVNSEEELLELYNLAKTKGFITALITDNGKTEFNGVPTNTAIAIGPDYGNNLKELTGRLKLL